MRTQYTQLISFNRLPGQSALACSIYMGKGYNRVVKGEFNGIAISCPDHDSENKWKRRT